MSIENMGLTGKFVSVISVAVLIIMALTCFGFITFAGRALEQQAADFVGAMEQEGRRNAAILHQGLVAKGELLGDTLAGTVGRAIWDMDDDTVRRIAENAEQDQEIARVEFFDDGGSLITEERGNVTAGARVIDREILFEEKKVGTLRLVLSSDRVESLLGQLNRNIGQARDKALAAKETTAGELLFDSLVFSLLGLLSLCLLNYLLLSRMIIRPLHRDMDFAEAIRTGDLSQRLSLESRDEIGQLAWALNGMADGLQEKARIAESIAGGDLRIKVTLASDQDELGKSLQKMVANLRGMVGEIQLAAHQIAAGSAQVSGSSQALSQGATGQAGTLAQISSFMTQMTSQTTCTADNAAAVNRLSDEAKNAAESGNRQMQAMVSAMGEISEASTGISRIIKVIDEIAFQTNLLALNAAVEAARAGQYGKGFAVVAEEVRTLAARSAKAASETAELISGSVHKVETGTSIATTTAEALGDIVAGVTKVSDLVEEIAFASGEQAKGINQVNQGLSQVDQVTRQNTAEAEESAASAEQLSAQAQQLLQMLERFQAGKDNTEAGPQRLEAP